MVWNQELLIEELSKGLTFQQLKRLLGKLEGELREQLSPVSLTPTDIGRRLQQVEENGYQIKRDYNDYGVSFQIVEEQAALFKPIYSFSLPFKALIITDTHIGSAKAQLECLRSIGHYADMTHIHHIFHLGDLVNGIHKNERTKISLSQQKEILQAQLSLLKECYPVLKEAQTGLLLGNHDIWDPLLENDLIEYLRKFRPDIFPLNQECCGLQIGPILIALHHPFSKSRLSYEQQLKPYFSRNVDLVLKGHTHHSECYQEEGMTIFEVAPLLKNEQNHGGACILEVTMSEQNKYQITLRAFTLSHGIEEATKHRLLIRRTS